jgi:hypothetical protein
MLQRRQSDSFSLTGFHGFIPEENKEQEETDADGLEDAARSEREYVSRRLREELGREPTEQELDDWLRQHTEGY